MALSLAKLEALRDALLEARFSGELTVSYSSGESQVEATYRSDAELRRALADCERRIAGLSGQTPVSTIRVAYSKGL